MKDRAFREMQWRTRYEPRVTVVNRFVDELSAGGRDVPYVGSHYDVRVARILSLSSNPGPRAGGDRGSGFISFCNDDPSAQRMLEMLQAAALSEVDTVPWNIHPWHVHDQQGGGLASSQVTAGVPALVRFLELVSTIRFVVLHGRGAQTGWKRLLREHPGLGRRYRAWETFHTSNRAFTGCSVEVRNERLARLAETYREVAAAL
jgi:hypothetical protein